MERLSARGFALEHIPGLIRNVLNLMGEGIGGEVQHSKDGSHAFREAPKFADLAQALCEILFELCQLRIHGLLFNLERLVVTKQNIH